MFQDIRYALRGMRRSPGFTLVALMSLALGIGANTAIFSLIEAAMLRMLPVSHPEQLVELLQKYPGEPRGNGYWSWRSYEHIRDNNHVFSALIGTTIDNHARLESDASEPAFGIAEYVSGNYFRDLGVKMVIGRGINPEDNPLSADGAVAVVSWSQWSNRFHQDPRILGKRILVQNVPATIIGVTTADFVGLRVEAKTDVWLPHQPEPTARLALVARLRPGTTLQKTRAEMAVLYRFTIDERAADSKDPLVRQLSIQVDPAGNGLATMRDRFGEPLAILMAVVGLLLLLACVNLASMLLARVAGRQREIAVRASLGASGVRLLRQVLTESLLLSVSGTLLGALVAYFGTSALLRILASGRQHEIVHLRVQPDIQIVLFTAAIALLASLVFGAAPAWAAFRTLPGSAIRQTGSLGDTPARRLLGRSLVAVQVSVSVLLLSLGVLFITNLENLERRYLGFRRDHVLLVTLDPSASSYSREQLSRAYQDILDRLTRIPGVRSASLSAPTPLRGDGASGFATAEGFQELPEDRRRVLITYVAPRYFETLGTPLLAGREFSFDDEAHPSVAVINQSFARYYFAGRDPIGKHLTLEHVTGVAEPKTYEVVGISGDANYLEIREPSKRAIYLPAFRSGYVAAQTFVIRTTIDPEGAATDIRRAIRGIVPGIPVARMITLDDQIDASIVPERLIAALSGFFGALGALLAGVGLYGLLSYTVSRRTNEIGVRMALGATARDVTRLVLEDALLTVAVGLAFGIPLATAGRSLVLSMIPGLALPATTPLVIASLGILAVALIAVYRPARRAARIDPLEAVRHE